jgi:hypothetical protein
MGKRKPTIIVDLDGVIHSYTSGWQGVDIIPDPPVPGAREALIALSEKFTICVLSTRCSQPGGAEAVREYLKKHDIVVDRVIVRKVPAVALIDDRGIRFEGDWKATAALLMDETNLVPWNKK